MWIMATAFISSIAWGQNFSLITESDNGDYIWWGKSRNLSTVNKDKLTLQTSDNKNLQFTIESFNFMTPMSFSFGSEDGKSLTKGLYDPAKRYPFRWSYNGIDISGDGRGCNTILGKFYVHEYSLTNNGTLDKAAIDFVQYCEWWSAGLYGSLRYNSSIASSCTTSSCAGAKNLLGITTQQNSTTPNTNTTTPTRPSTSNPDTTRPTTPSTTTHLRRAYRRSYNNFTNFMNGEYRYTYARNFRNVQRYCDINNLFDRDPNSPYYLNPNACGEDMREAIMAFNEWWAEALSEGDSDDSMPTLQEFRRQRWEFRKAIRELQKERRVNRIPELDVIYSLWQLMLIDIDYQVHREIFGL